MLDPKILRSDLESVKQRLKKRGYELDSQKYLELEKNRKLFQTKVEELRNERKVRSKSIGQAIRDGGDAAALKAEVGRLGEDLSASEARLHVITQELDDWFARIPNLPQDSVPDGTDEADNVPIRHWGEVVEQTDALDHVAIGEMMGQMDFESAAKISGARFVVLKKDLARLHRALTQFMLDTHIAEHGYEELYVPYLVLPSSLKGTGQLPKFSEDLFATHSDQGLHLIPTAEVPVTNMVRDRILENDELPLKYVCHTPCFRSEAGSHGKDTRGLIRQHQFEKVEMVHIVRPDESETALEALTKHAENILKKLELPYRVVALCGGDLGFSAAKTYDIEVWVPSQNCYREISSCSNFEDFQARRMLARYRSATGEKPSLVHTLNGSGLAVGRTLVALLENAYDHSSKQIVLPEALHRYMGGEALISL